MSSQGSFAKICALLPSRLIIPIAECRLLTVSYTVWRPSGDHRGVPIGTSEATELSCIELEPSAFADQSCRVPSRSETKTIMFPSGEYSALSVWREENKNFSGIAGVVWFSVRRQTFVF